MESSALRACASPSCTYELQSSVIENPNISSPQLEAIAYCCEQHEKSFGDYRLGYVLGDGTGTYERYLALKVKLLNTFNLKVLGSP